MRDSAPLPRLRLWAEFLALFLAVPVAMAIFSGLYPLFPVLIAFALTAVFLLWSTPGFTPRELVRWPVRGHRWILAGFGIGCLGLTFGFAMAMVPDRFLEIPRQRPGLWLAIMGLYPLFSAMPQELIFRPLFFRRYGSLFPNDRIALIVNAAAFALAHLFYMNPLTIGLAGLAGLTFGWVYLRTGSFLLAVVLHALAGQLVFTSGLGVFFYHGAIGNMP